MTDPNFWKNQYATTWGQSSARETAIAATLTSESGKLIKPVGLGAGSSEYLPGSAAQHGHIKGEADLEVEGTNVRLEVTGPLVKTIDASQPLWIRPDKLAHARSSLATLETWVIHHLPRGDLHRVLRLDGTFFVAQDRGEFRIVTPSIRGVRETYLEISASHPVVQPLSALIARLKEL